MISVIGLGSAGCNIAEMFEDSQGMSVYLIDKDIEGENCFSVESQKSSEDYEKYCPDLTSFFKDISKDVIFIVGGSGKISGVTLKVLNQIKNKNISLLYIKDESKTRGIEAFQQRVTFNVLQEYARSGLFKEICLITNELVEEILGEVPIIGYHDALNKLIYNTITSINYLADKDSVIENYSDPKEVHRICTYGIYDINTDVERLFFPLDFAEQKCYYFGVKEDDLKRDTRLLKNIKEKMNSKSSSGCINYFKIFKTSLETNYCYVKAYSKKIQT